MGRILSGASASFNTLSIPALQQGSEARLFDAVFDESEAGLVILDVADNCIPVVSDINPVAAAWLGSDRTALKGYRFLELLDREKDREALETLQQAFSVRSEIEVDAHVTAGASEQTQVSMKLKPIVMDNSRVFFGVRERYLVILRRTDAALEAALAQYQKACEKAELARDRFLARMSHDLRTPLGGILGFADAMNMEILGPIGNDRYQEYISAILQSGQNLMGLVEDLLAESQAWQDKVRLQKVEADLAIVVARLVSAMKPEATVRKVALLCEAEPGMQAFEFDINAIEKALSAVIGNAIAASPGSSRVHIVVMTEGGVPCVIVEDSGSPVAEGQWEAEIARIPDEDDVYRTVYDRAVGGLPFARTIMELHGGRLECGEASSIRNPDRRISVMRLRFGCDEPVQAAGTSVATSGPDAAPATDDEECWEIG